MIPCTMTSQRKTMKVKNSTSCRSDASAHIESISCAEAISNCVCNHAHTKSTSTSVTSLSFATTQPRKAEIKETHLCFTSFYLVDLSWLYLSFLTYIVNYFHFPVSLPLAHKLYSSCPALPMLCMLVDISLIGLEVATEPEVWCFA